MVRVASTEVIFRIIVEQPVPGVLYGLQSKDGQPLDPKASRGGEPLAFEFPVRVASGPEFSGDQVRREGPERRFVYIRIGQLAGDATSPWSRRMKIDIHGIGSALIERAIAAGGPLELSVSGTGKYGTPACATVQSGWSIGTRTSRHRRRFTILLFCGPFAMRLRLAKSVVLPNRFLYAAGKAGETTCFRRKHRCA